ncbi:hypothetical protein [Burkholderia sp. LMG 32019]|uniref:hypothetical protein n=1 Tax=Burkholderia sp. LMG 32019 TaxID=3158173 RepID=UPI003C2FE6DD
MKKRHLRVAFSFSRNFLCDPDEFVLPLIPAGERAGTARIRKCRPAPPNGIA